MRRLSTLIAVFVCSALADQSWGQQSPATNKDFRNADLTRTTTYILPTGDDHFDKALKNAVEANWSISPIGPIEDLQGISDRLDPRRTYIGYSKERYHNLASIVLVRGGVNGSFTVIDDIDILSKSWMDVYQEGLNDHHLPLLVSTLQQAVRMRMAPEKKFDRPVVKDFNLLTHRLRGKKLLFEPNPTTYDADVESVKQAYHHEIRIVDHDEAVEAIAGRRSDEALIVCCSVNPWVFVYDLDTRECVFWGGEKTREKSLELLNDLVSE